MSHQELAKYILHFDIGVMPDSNDYGSPLKIFEYAAMRKPVVAPRLKPLEDVIEDGVNGVLFKAKDKKALANSVLKLLTDEKYAKRLAENAYEKVMKLYTWQNNAKAIFEKWDEVFKRRKEIRFVLQYFYPEVASTAQLMTQLAEELVKKGVSVKVLSGQPSYVSRKKIASREVYNGIEIERMPCTRFEKNSFLGKMMNWISYTILVFFKLLFSRDHSLLFIVSTPPFLFVVGYLLKIVRRQKYVCLIYDLYPDIAEKLGYIKDGSLISRLWDSANKAFFRKANLVIVPCENMRELVEGKISKNGVVVIHNWADGEFIKPINKKDNWFAKRYGLADKLVVLYAGNIGLFHQLETLVEAAEKLKESDYLRFVFIGEGGKKKKLMEMVERKGLKNIMFLPYQNKDALPYSLTCSDISVVSLEKGLDCVAAPCKLYTSLAGGQVIFGLVDKTSEVAKVIEEGNCGFYFDQDDVKGVVQMLNRLKQDDKLKQLLQGNARRCFENNFKKEKMIEKYYQALKKVIEER